MVVKRARACLILVVLLALASALSACGGGESPATPAATPPPPTPTPVPPTPTPALPEGWVENKTTQFSLALPASWQVIDLTNEDLEAVFERMKETNPNFANMLGSAEAMQGFLLWAFNTDSKTPGFTDNVNVRNLPLEGMKLDVQKDVLEPVQQEYAKMNFNFQEMVSDLQIGGYPAGRITYDFAVNTPDGASVTVTGRQYAVITEKYLWILTYSVGSNEAEALMAVVDRSAQSFRELK
ncbi:MAG: hypothetical protein NZ528_08710 [Caldilineales bacterium]|nr:hypothetical protein [Caldilineales bacterium]